MIDFERKMIALPDLLAKRADFAAPVVLTNGVFDMLHRGHVSYLAQAKAMGACLIVAVNTDASVKLLNKAPDRPINGEQDRMAMLAALAAVDWVVSFAEQTPIHLITQVRPDIYVKGGDYDIDHLAEADLVRSWGGKAVAIPFIYDYSTTHLLKKIRQNEHQ